MGKRPSGAPRVPSRKLRFWIGNGSVRFYSRGDVKELVAGAGIPPNRASILSYDRDWILISRLGAQG